MSVKIEGVPDGYELVRIGCPQEGETYINAIGLAVAGAAFSAFSASPYFAIVRKIEPTTRPMTRDEFLAAWKQRGFCPLIDTEGVVRAVITVDSGELDNLFVETYDEWHEFDELKSWKFASDESPISVTEY